MVVVRVEENRRQLVAAADMVEDKWPLGPHLPRLQPYNL